MIGSMKTQNPIEQITPLLHEVGDRPLTGAGRVEIKLAALAAAEAEVRRCKQEAKEGRGSLLAAVRQSYVDFEIETADVLRNRLNTRKGVNP